MATFNDAIIEWAKRRLPTLAEVFSDGLGAFRRFVAAVPAHAVLESKIRRAAAVIDRARWTHALLSHLKRSIGGTHHVFTQHADARRYQGVAAYRLNHRIHWPDFTPRLVRAMVRCRPSPEPFWRQATSLLCEDQR